MLNNEHTVESANNIRRGNLIKTGEQKYSEVLATEIYDEPNGQVMHRIEIGGYSGKRILHLNPEFPVTVKTSTL